MKQRLVYAAGMPGVHSASSFYLSVMSSVKFLNLYILRTKFTLGRNVESFFVFSIFLACINRDFVVQVTTGQFDTLFMRPVQRHFSLAPTIIALVSGIVVLPIEPARRR